MRDRPLTLTTKLYYGVGAVAFGVKDSGFQFFLLLYYNQVLGLPAAWVGAGIMIALVADAISDPIVGHLSDNLHSRWGRRHPFMYAAAVPVAVAFYYLWNPPSGLSQEGLFAYFLLVSILVRTLITLYEIPSTSLVAELTDDYDERTSMLGFRFFFGWWGGLGLAVVAYLILLAPDALHPDGQLNPAGYRTYGLVASITILAAILTSAIGTHRHIPHLKQPPPPRPFDLRRTAHEMAETLGNRSFLVLFVAAIFAAMAAGLSSSLNIYFNTYFWELTSKQIGFLTVFIFLSAAVALGLAPAAAKRIGKKPAAIAVSLAAILLAPVPIVLRLLEVFPANHSPNLLPALIVFNVVEVTLIITSSILVSSMVADIVEDSEIRTGRRSEGLFFAARSLVAKAVSGIGVFMASILLGVVEFPAGATPGEVAPETVRSLGIAFAPTLVVLHLVSLAFMSAYRISRSSHQENLRRLRDAAPST